MIDPRLISRLNGVIWTIRAADAPETKAKPVLEDA
jgi:hypothetical protein